MPTRWRSGLSEMYSVPVLVCADAPPLPDPVEPTTSCTAGSACTIAIICVNFLLISWNEMPWSACRLPIMRPVSSSGKKPFGMIVISHTFSATVPISSSSTGRL